MPPRQVTGLARAQAWLTFRPASARVADRHPAFTSIVKRSLDLGASVALLLLLSPVLLTVAAILWLGSGGPVVIAQQRVGYQNKIFNMYKFRTMTHDATRQEAEMARMQGGTGFVKFEADPRITSVGRLLRRTSLDELPQLVNVLRGEMSLVGPRPLLQRDVEQLAGRLPSRRFIVRPGLTGSWQVNGRSLCTTEERIRYDLEYVDNWSLISDFRLLAQTIPAVLRGHGAC
jgi:lipopolysaccharide/colanic/teichoic acid biosynthesis glycosyltransferase